MPAGVSLAYEGNMKQQAEAFGSLGLALIASIIFVYLIMVALYNSYIYPFVVLFSIPVAMVGALLALALTMQSLNIFSLLGVIMLIGLVAKNAILLVDYTNQLKGQGYKVKDALLIPEADSACSDDYHRNGDRYASPGARERGRRRMKNGMAWVLIGGLTS